jgi:uncharacterized protein
VRVSVRFYAELNDFLPPAERFSTVCHWLEAAASVKDFVESHGVPHTEVDLLLVNGESVGFRRVLADGDRLAVYPIFEAFDIATITRVRPEPLRETRFLLDVHLGKLTRHLRLAGFDCLYGRALDDAELARLAAEQRRILLTRDVGLLKRSAVTHGYYVRETDSTRQLAEVVGRFDLARTLRPFTRCTCCNHLLESVDRAVAEAAVPERSLQHFETFLRCTGCLRVYWRGSHAARLDAILRAAVLGATGE